MLSKILQTESDSNAALFITTLWFIWFSRNRVCFEGKRVEPLSLSQQIQAFTEETLSALEARAAGAFFRGVS